MKAYIISIGDEILIGQITNTNASWIAKELNLIGISIAQIVSVGDTLEAIIEVLSEASQKADIVFITGGLGPTSDDITKPALYSFFGSKPLFSQTVFEHIEKLIEQRGFSMNELNRQQAIVADNCTIIQNSCGTAPGMWFEKDGKVFVAMPGVPFEMENMMTYHIMPRITAKYTLPVIVHRNIMTTGIAESTLAIAIEEWEKQLPSHIKLAYLPSPGIVKLRLSATGKSKAKLNDEIAEQIEALKPYAENYIFSEDEKSIDQVIAEMLIEKGKTLSIAESCTGGYMSHLLTSRSGSSAYFKGSIVAYSNEIKTNELSVPRDIIEKYGAVSRETVEDMAQNIRVIFDTDFSIAISGIAGPDGGTPDKPVGTVWVAVTSSKGLESKMFNTGDHRGRNITRASINAFNMLYKFILDEPILQGNPSEDNQ